MASWPFSPSGAPPTHRSSCWSASKDSQHARAPKKHSADDPQEPPLIRWSVQEIRRVAVRLTQRQIEPAAVIAWSLWRRAHQAAAQHAHVRSKMQL
jgi:hypothetical protein